MKHNISSWVKVQKQIRPESVKIRIQRSFFFAKFWMDNLHEKRLSNFSKMMDKRMELSHGLIIFKSGIPC
jgi:hypothetical protein